MFFAARRCRVPQVLVQDPAQHQLRQSRLSKEHRGGRQHGARHQRTLVEQRNGVFPNVVVANDQQLGVDDKNFHFNDVGY